MSEPFDSDGRERAAGSVDPAGALDHLRDLLLAPDRNRIQEVRERIDSKEVSADEVARVLPQAVRQRVESDDSFSKALMPTVESAIEGSVRRNPRVLADAIFPLMGPAIRKSIRQALAGMLEGINRTVEHSITPRGIRWRLEARRTGRPFAEVVLKHSLVFRVEQVLLIHRETALLLENVHLPELVPADADMVSGLLGAIQDFVSDSFGAGQGVGIEQVEFGDQTLEVAIGPHAMLACVVRGIVPAEVRVRLQEVLEELHASRAELLRTFAGDTTPFLALRPQLEDLLQERRRKPTRNPLVPWVSGALLLALLLVGTVFVARLVEETSARRQAEEALRAEPGLVYLGLQDRDRPTFVGLRDPLARDPADVVRAMGLDPGAYDFAWEPYASLDPEFVLDRARRLLDPPLTVSVRVEDERLTLSGRASREWTLRARQLAAHLPGVLAVDATELVDDDTAQLGSLAVRFETRRLSFDPGAATPTAGGSRDAFLETFRELEQGARDARVPLEVVVRSEAVAAEVSDIVEARCRTVWALLREDSGGHATIRLDLTPASGDPAAFGTGVSVTARLMQASDEVPR